MIFWDTNSLNRRDFLKTSFSGILSLPFVLESCNKTNSLNFTGKIVGEDVKLGHLFRDGKIIPPPTKPVGGLYSCIVVGGGCSGVAAGWRLNYAGVNDFLILEKGSQLGGTAQSGVGNGTEHSWGAHYIETPPPEANFLYPLYEDLGIILGYKDDGWPVVNSEFVVKEPEIHLYTGKEWTPHRYPYPLANKKDLNEFQRFRKKMYEFYHTRGDDGKSPFTLPIQATSTDNKYRKLDLITMKDYMLSERYNSSLLDWYVDVQCRDNFGTRYDEISAWVAVNYLSTNFSHFDPEEEKKHPSQVLSWAEGNQYLVKGMSKGFKEENIRLNAMVVDIRNEKDYSLVTYYQSKENRFYTHKAKSVIFALPKFLLPRIYKDMKDRIQYLSKFEYAPWIVANLYVKYPPNNKQLAWDNIYYRKLNDPYNWSLGYILANYQDNHLLNKMHDPTILTFYAPLLRTGIDNERKTLLNNDWNYWAELIVKDLSFMHPNITDLIERLDIYKWGHAMIRSKPGFVWGRERKEIAKPIKQIYMAHCDIGGLPIFEQAAYSGIQSAESVLSLLNKSFTKMIK